MITGSIVLYALLGGLLPSLFWLWFWLREDTVHPEPRSIIAATFVAGMIAAPLALFPEKLIIYRYGTGTFATLALWALTEEFFKFAAAWIIALRFRKIVDEPIDAMVYLITAALGFSAAENMLFLLAPLRSGIIFDTIITGNLRFIGASLLHIVASAIIGLFIALAFYKKKSRKFRYLLAGLVFATSLHTLFNFSILNEQGNQIFLIFSGLWIGAVLLLLVFEKVKRISP